MGQYGAYETVENIYVSDVQFKGSLSGVRIKTWQVISSHEIWYIYNYRLPTNNYLIIYD